MAGSEARKRKRPPNASRARTNLRILVAMESAEQVRTPSLAPLCRFAQSQDVLNALADEALADSAAGATKTPRSPRPGHHAHIGLLPVACEVFPLGLDQREAFTLRTHRGAIDRGSLRHRSRSGRGITVTLSATG